MEPIAPPYEPVAETGGGWTLPTPIAVHYEQAYGSQYPAASRWEALPHTAEQVLRVVGSTLLAAYAATDSSVRAQKLNNVIGAMCPSFFPIWQALLTQFGRLPKMGSSTVLQKFHAEFRQAYQSVSSIFLERDGNPILEWAYAQKPENVPPRVPLLDTFRLLRNFRAHTSPTARYPEDDLHETCLPLLLPPLQEAIKALAPLWRFRLELVQGNGQVLRFEGEAPFAVPASKSHSPRKAVLLVSPEGDVAPLSPFFIPSDQEEYLLIFDGYFLDPQKPEVPANIVSYQGAHQEVRKGPTAQALRQFLADKGVNLTAKDKNVQPWTLAESLRERSRRLVETPSQAQPLENTFLERKKLAEPLWRFLTEPLPEGTGKGFILTGRSGTGKSALLYQAANRLLQITKGAGSHDIVLYLRCDRIAEQDEDALYSALLNQVDDASRKSAAGKPASARFDEFFRNLGKQLQLADFEDRKFILMVDAVNEAPAPERLYRHLLDLIESVQIYSWIRVVAAIREEFLEVFRGRLTAWQSDPLPSFRPRLFAPDSKEDASVRDGSLPVWVVPELSPDERKDLYGNYQRAHDRNATTYPACLTPWEKLAQETRDVLTTPLRILVWMKAFDGRTGGTVVDLPELFAEYLKTLSQRAPRLTTEWMPMIADYMIENGRAQLSHDDVTILDKSSDVSPIAALVSEGILERQLTTRHQVVYKIFHQRLAEGMIAERLWLHAIDPAKGTITAAGVAAWGAPQLTQNLIGALEYIIQERLLAKERYAEAMLVLDKVDFQLSPKNSWLFAAGRVQSSVRFRRKLAGVLTSFADRCHNSYQLALGLIRLGQCQEAEEIIESISEGVSKELSKDFRAAVLTYRALALNTRGQSAEALRILRRAIPLCRGSPIEGNVRGNLASVKIKLAGIGSCCPPRSRKAIAQRLRALLFFLPLLSAYRNLGQAIRITRQHEDQRSAAFWEAARAYFLGVLGWHARAVLELERILAGCQAKGRDAHVLLFINRYAGEVYSVKDGGKERGLNYLASAKLFAVEIGDAENIRQIEDLLKLNSNGDAPAAAACT